MKVQEMMTANPACCTPDATIREAAQFMLDNDCGAIPVVEDTESMRLIGIVTDRDLAVRAIATGKGPDTKVREVMSSQAHSCAPGDDVKVVQRVMAERQVRRVPVVDGEGCCVGIVAQADIALEEPSISDREVARVIERISEPTREVTRRPPTAARPEPGAPPPEMRT